MLRQTMRAIVAAAALAVVVSMTAQTRVDVDLWGHVRFGSDILEARALHATDPYSFTSDRPWINHEWLAEIAMALAWRVGGAPGLIALKLACAAAALLLILSTLKARGVAGHARVILLGLTLLGVLPRITQVRPQLFSVLFFAALVRIFARADSGRTRALLWTIPILAAWANFHGGWVVGAATVALWCAGEAYALRAQPARATLALACAPAAVAATLLNPYGIGLWRFLRDTVGFGRHAIREWGSAWTDPATLIVWGVFALLAAAALRDALARPPRNPASLLIPAAWGLAALRVGRLDAFFALSVVGLMSVWIAPLVASRRPAGRLPRAWQAAVLALAGVIVLAVPSGRRAFTCIAFHPQRWPEPDAVRFMADNTLSGRAITYFDWGEYAIWHLPPSLKVSIDGRRETVYSERTTDGHLAIYAGTGQGVEYLRELAPDYVWLPRGAPVLDALQRQGWRLVFDGPRSKLLASAAAPDVIPLAIEGEPPLRCFPGP